MSESPFVQLLRSEKAIFLLSHHPLAFALLTYIAMHARRYNDHPDGLIIGDALVGFTSMPGLSRQNFRTALEKLTNDNLIKIVSNGRNWWGREKSTIKVTINSHLVNLCDTSIYDINSEDGNHQSNHPVTIDQPSTNHKQERTRTKELKEQQQTPTPLPVESVGSLVVCSFSCLDGLGLSKDDLEKLAGFDEVDVIRGVKVLKEYKKPIDSVMGYLLKAIKGKWQPKSNPEFQLSDRAKSNREKLLKYARDAEEALNRKDLVIMDCIDHAMFGTEKLPYEHEDFKELVKSARMKFNLWHSAPKPIVEDNCQNNSMSHVSTHAMNLLANSEHFKK